MRELFDQFELLSNKAQELLRTGISKMQVGIAPDDKLCHDITSALISVRTVYDNIRATIPEHILKNELPEGDLSVQEYEEAWKNSVVARKEEIRKVLQEFIRVYSDEKKYMDAIEPYIDKAKEKLGSVGMIVDQEQSPDISPFRLFLAGINADLSQDTELYDAIVDTSGFNPRIILGLYEHKYYLREHDSDDLEQVKSIGSEDASETEQEDDEIKGVTFSKPADSSEEQQAATEDNSESGNQITSQDNGVIEEDNTVEEKTDCLDTASASPVEDSAENINTDAETKYIHPINPIRPIGKLPSEQKLKELVLRTRSVLDFLFDELTFSGLMDETYALDSLVVLQDELTREQCIDIFALLERKGLLCIYEYEKRNILCFTELMEKCIQKSSLLSLLKRILGRTKIFNIRFIGKQDMPLEQFTQQLALVDHYTHAMDVLRGSEENTVRLVASGWDDEKSSFFLQLSMDEKELPPLYIVDQKEFSTVVPNDGEGVICCTEDYPDMYGVSDHAHYCLTSKGLFVWSGDQWDGVSYIETQEPDEAREPDGERTKDDNLEPEVVLSVDSTQEKSSQESIEEKKEESPSMPIVPIKQENVEKEQTEGLWLDDLSEDTERETEVTADEFTDLSSVEIAQRLLSTTADGSTPSDENMAVLIHQLLSEGIRSHDVHNCHDQLIEAIVLAKLLSTNDAFPSCRNIYYQIHAAIPLFKEATVNTGANLTSIFACETEYTPVTKLCAYIYGMLFPVSAHDHTFAALYNNAFTEFELQFPGLDAFKPLYHKAMEALKLVPTAFSQGNLSALSDSKLRQEHMNSICARAKELLKPPTIKFMINGVPELIDICFGTKSNMHTALEIVSENDVSMRVLVEEEFEQYSVDNEIDVNSLEQELDSQWNVAAQKYSSRRMGIKYAARKHLLQAFEDRLSVLQEWLNETNTEAAPLIERLRPIRNDIINIIEDVLSAFTSEPHTPTIALIKASLELIRTKLQNKSMTVDFSTMYRSGALVINHGEVVLNNALNEITFAEPWRMMLQHIADTEYDLRIVYDKILSADPKSTLYDNFGQLEAICKLLGEDPKTNDEKDLKGAIESADIQAKYFKDKLEISYAYNRISENDRERLAMLADLKTSAFKDFFYENRAFGCWRGFLNALRSQIRVEAQRSMKDVRAQLDQAKQTIQSDEDDALLVEAERLISQEQNFAVAEDYIHRFRKGERAFPLGTIDEITNYYLDFISDGVFDRLYKHCENYKNASLWRMTEEYLKKNPQEGKSARYYKEAESFASTWPKAKQNVDPQNVQKFFTQLGFNVLSCVKNERGGEKCCTLTVRKSEQNQADYRHPIALFGTLMKPKVEVVCLFGKRVGKQLVDDVCKLGISGTFLVLLDANLSSIDRRDMAEYFFTQKNVGQSSFLVIDRVLALYLAMKSSNERLPAMLQCTLPYTIYQPFSNGSGSTPDEMFCGRVNELAAIRDMAGASIVYGGRQLGKTALLERAKHLDNNPERKEFAVMSSFKGCRGEQSFLEILVSACNEAFEKHGIRLNQCESIRELCSQINNLIKDEKIKSLRLLLDETDDFLESISASNYIEILPLIDLQRKSNHQFKFVLAGLHNVCRAKNATRNNGLFGQLGAPLCVKPLTASDARNLLVRPLRYLGFRVSNELSVDTILTNTNYYPGIIQFFGYNLVQTLASQYSQYYSKTRGNPPYELRDDHLAAIMNSQDLNRSIKDRLRWTLEMDERYYMLARCITVLYHLHSDDYPAISNGFDVMSIREIAKDLYDIHCLASLSEKETIALLDEMEEMGILSHSSSENNRYLLRRRSFIDVIGKSIEKLEHDIQLNNEEVMQNA